MIEAFEPVAAIVLVAFAAVAANDAALAAGGYAKAEVKSGATPPTAGGMMKQSELMGGAWDRQPRGALTDVTGFRHK